MARDARKAGKPPPKPKVPNPEPGPTFPPVPGEPERDPTKRPPKPTNPDPGRPPPLIRREARQVLHRATPTHGPIASRSPAQQAENGHDNERQERIDEPQRRAAGRPLAARTSTFRCMTGATAGSSFPMLLAVAVAAWVTR
jgi:hypothetical protein